MTVFPLADLKAALGPDHAAVIDTTTLTRALYSTDASIYRVVPEAVARPRTTEAVSAVLEAARHVGVPVTARGAGTSCAGNAVGPGLVLDLSRLNRIVRIDPEARIAVVEPGVVQETLQRAARPHGLRFGPDPSTSTRCTIGGMIANNACGPRALGYGVSATNLVDAHIHTGTGVELDLSNLGEHETGRRLLDLIDANLATVRTQFGRFSRQMSGYSLEHLLPENGPFLSEGAGAGGIGDSARGAAGVGLRGRDTVRFFAGSEGTLGIATELTVRLVADPAHTLTIALGYPSMAEAADAVTALLPFSPTAVEGMDRRLVEIVRRAKGEAAVPPLPRGDGWSFVELAGDDPGELAARAERLIAAAGALEGWAMTDREAAARLWKIRSDGAGLAGISLDAPAYPGWEDAAVPPERLGTYLREFDALLDEYGFHGLPYGHFGEGCVHVRVDFPLTTPGGTQRYRDFVTDAARLVARHGGSLSGEHGDGRARSALLSELYDPTAIALFRGVKALFDPEGLLNPGILVDPAPVDSDVRAAGLIDREMVRLHPRFAQSVSRCSGVGACVAAHPAGVMCPSYQATREEKDATRGRSRVLQEMLDGRLVDGDWAAPEVAEALEFCLSCKGCSSDCPAGVDIAAAKSVVLDEKYRGRLRPRSHYAMGQLPKWGRLITSARLGTLANLATATPGVVHLMRWVAGVDQRRPLPKFARGVSGRRKAVEALAKLPHSSHATPVAVWVDSFNDCFEQSAVSALLRVLAGAGFAPRIIEQTACCGLTWITTGQRDEAAKRLNEAAAVLGPLAQAGVPIIGVEPSCLAVWKSDAADLIDDPRVADIGRAVHTLGELLAARAGYTPPSLAGRQIIVQPHCHQASVSGFAAETEILRRTGAEVTVLGGCCGLAGNFGVEKGHHDLSVAVAGNELLPALSAQPEAIVVADGFSCRKQVGDLTGRRVVSLAELLDEAGA
ncbi:MAG: FAD-binding oxidoreductase [Propionibacteriaceae bacterium]|nr:FAD-binding oxidoreductase [Propionibacteriaceae bacterium]